jgi:hypothetical protein
MATPGEAMDEAVQAYIDAFDLAYRPMFDRGGRAGLRGALR